MTNEITRSPDIIAGEINEIKSQASAILGAAFSVARQSCFEIGKRLEEAKSLLPHGEWGKWLSENVAYSESTANNLMRIYREFGDEQIDMLTGKTPREVFGDLSQSQLVALFGLPRAERVAYVEEHREEMQDQSVRDLERKIEEYKAALKSEREVSEKLREDIQEYKADAEYAEKNLTAARAELEEVKSRPVEAVASTVIVNQPSEEQIEQIRMDIAEEYAARTKEAEALADRVHADEVKKREKLQKDYEKKLADIQGAKEESEARIDAIRADYEKRLRAANMQGNVRQARLSIYLGEIARLINLSCDELDGMERDESESGMRMRAQLAAKLDKVLSERGLTV